MKNLHTLCVALLLLLTSSCSLVDSGDKAATYLLVTPSEITYAENAENTFTVNSDGDWLVTAITDKVKLSTKIGSAGKTTVEILSMSATSPQTIVIRTPSNPDLVGTLKIYPDDGNGNGGNNNDNNQGNDGSPTDGITLYYDNLDGNTSYTDWANTNTSWQNPIGEGAADVTYDSSYAKIRNDNYGSAGKYESASGSSYIRIFEPSNGSNNYLEVHNIATNGEQKLTLWFGAMFKASQCSLYIKSGDSTWQRLEYTASSTYNSWALAKASFTIVGKADKLSFRFEPSDANVNYGYNLDDLRLTTSAGGQTIEIAAKRDYNWAETPLKTNSKSDYVYHTHWSRSVNSKKSLRNFSYCYDVRRHSPMWIAHPQHAVYQEGGKTRPANDPWARDPYLTDQQSAIIYPIDGNICSLRTYDDESYSSHYQWGRGHMLASSYRGCGDKNNPAEINVQTFYSSNIAAQRSGDCAFQILWGAAERKIQDNYICTDTLYCVSGAHFANEKTTATDGNVFYIPSYSKTCVVPTHFYKIVLRTKSGSTGKAIQECSASELKAVGFWFSNTDIDEQTGSATPTLSRSHLRSVADIERLTGNEFSFFPEIPDEVKQSFNPSEWGF